MSPDDEVPGPPVKDFMSLGHQALLDRSTDLGLRLDAQVCCVGVCVCCVCVCAGVRVCGCVCGGGGLKNMETRMMNAGP